MFVVQWQEQKLAWIPMAVLTVINKVMNTVINSVINIVMKIVINTAISSSATSWQHAAQDAT